MKLKPLVKSSYTFREAVSRWQEVHEGYNLDYLQERIARDELASYLNLRNCYLFSVAGVNCLYKYLELFILPKNKKYVRVDDVHIGNDDLLKKRREFKKTFYISARVYNHVVIPGVDFNKTCKGIYDKTYGNQDLSEIFLNENDLFKSKHPLSKYDLESNCRGNIQGEQIIRVECPIPVTPLVSSNNEYGISFIPPEEINSLKKLNLSNTDRSLKGKLSQIALVQWNGKSYYVANLNKTIYKDSSYDCLSLSLQTCLSPTIKAMV